MIGPTVTLHHGDCLHVLRSLPDASIDAVVTDPPYGLAFMGKRWDYDVPSVEVWAECLRVLKPGGHLLAFAGTRTQHRMAVRIEDAGFEIRDLIAWVYGSGFPKSLNVAAAIAKVGEPKAEPTAEEVEFCAWLRESSSKAVVCATLGRRFWDCEVQIVNTATKENPVMARRALVPTAARWQQFKAQHAEPIPERIERLAKPEPIKAETPGEEWSPGKGRGVYGTGSWAGWGTALKPALEPITVARKPLAGTVAETVLAYGTGAINVGGCRVGDDLVVSAGNFGQNSRLNDDNWRGVGARLAPTTSVGRWPANLIHDGGPETGDLLGDAARFFYCAKASRADRDAGCNGLPQRTAAETVERAEGSAGLDSPRAGAGRTSGARNHHPTVKPTDLMRYLCRLVTRPGGIVLDPFMGSGSTGRGAVLEGFAFVGIEREADYLAIAQARIEDARQQAQAERPQPSLFDQVAD